MYITYRHMFLRFPFRILLGHRLPGERNGRGQRRGHFCKIVVTHIMYIISLYYYSIIVLYYYIIIVLYYYIIVLYFFL